MQGDTKSAPEPQKESVDTSINFEPVDKADSIPINGSKKLSFIKSKRKLLNFSFIALAIVGGVIAWFILKDDAPSVSNTPQSTSTKASIVASNQVVYFTQYMSYGGNSVNERFIKKLSLGNNKVETYLKASNDEGGYNAIVLGASPDKKQFVKVESRKVYVAAAANELVYKQVFPSSANEKVPGELSAEWADDSSGLIIVVTSTKGGGEDSIPVSDESVYFVSVKTGSTKKLFDHREIYGGLYILGTDSKRDELYWATEGEGGPREQLIISKLSTGAEIKKVGSVRGNYVTYSNGAVYFTAQEESTASINSLAKEKLQRYNITTDKIEALYTSPEPPKQTPEETNRIPGYYFGNIIGSLSSNKIIFSQVGWSKGKSTTTLFEIDTTTRKLSKLYSIDNQKSDVDIELLVQTDTGILASTFCNLCGEAGKTPRELVLIQDGESLVLNKEADASYGEAFMVSY